METKTIAKVNNVDIVSTNDEQKLVPIKPICTALGIAFEPQYQKLKDDEDLSSVITLSITTGSDGKKYEMACLPMEFIFGWIFTISPKNVSPEAKESVRKYRMECYKVLFDHFTEPQTFLKQKQEVMEKKVAEYQECQRRFKDAQKLMNEAKTELNQVMKFTIDDWRANNRQLTFSFDNAE